MADYFFASIDIGGPIKRRQVDGLVEAIRAEGFADDEYAPIKLARPTDLLKHLSKEGHLHFQNPETPWGIFEGLEEFLTKRRIPYDRHSDGYCEIHAENVYYRPGLPEPIVRMADNDAGEWVPRDEIESLLRINSIHYLRRRLRKILGQNVPPLPPIDPYVFGVAAPPPAGPSATSPSS